MRFPDQRNERAWVSTADLTRALALQPGQASDAVIEMRRDGFTEPDGGRVHPAERFVLRVKLRRTADGLELAEPQEDREQEKIERARLNAHHDAETTRLEAKREADRKEPG